MYGKLLIILVVLLLKAGRSIGEGDTLSRGQSLTGTRTLTSNNGMFELGIFEISTNRFYLSIRYKQVQRTTTVWVANRENPLSDAAASELQIASDGRLQLSNGGDVVWSTPSSLSTSPALVLRDDGNLILSEGLWQSFDYPTHTWLPGATLGPGRRLVSWTSEDDPSPGMFSAEISPESTLVFKWNGSAVYWESGSLEFSDMIGLEGELNYFSFDKQAGYWRLGDNGIERLPDNTNRSVLSMLEMDHKEGRLRRLTWWSWGQENPRLLPAYPLCGAYEIRSGMWGRRQCTCMHGFKPSSWGWGCERNTSLPNDCEGEGEEGFMEIRDMMQWPMQPKLRPRPRDAKECGQSCLWSCSCNAYAFDQDKCMVWEGDLYNMTTDQTSGKGKLHLKLAASDLPKEKSKSKILTVIIAVGVPVLVLVSGGFLGFFYNRRRTKHNKAMHGIGKLLAISIIVLVMAERSSGVGDTLAQGESLTGNQILTSKNGTFQMGFFETSEGTGRFYLSIRYTKLKGQPLVWVANRDKPLPDATASILLIATNGNLELFNGRDLFWNISLSTSAESAVLGENGNLIVRDGGAGAGVVWQSFDHPTHTWLPGATLGFDKKTGTARRLVSWKSNEDPSPGEFVVEITPESKMVLKWKETTVYFESESDGSGNNQFGFGSQLLNSLSIRFEMDKQSTYVRLENTEVIMSNDSSRVVFAMLVMDDQKGRLKRVPSRDEGGGGAWATPSALPPELFCGAYGVLQVSGCTCLSGFQASLSPNTMGGSCYRSASISDCNGKIAEVGFIVVSGIKWPNQPKIVRVRDGGGGGGGDNECKAACQQSCSCTAYAFNGSECLVWKGDLYGIRTDIADDRNLYVKLASSALPDTESKSKTLEVVIAVVVPVLVIVSGGFLGFFYNRRTKHNKENKEPGDDLLSFDFDVSINATNDGTTLRNMEFDLPMFSYSSVSAATNNFSPQNKLGEGGFGPVYKGELLNGERIALKRLSQKSGQGFEEFRNEIILIAKLQHRNLVRILGCCIHPVESILIYEYMPNKSLDMFLFGSEKQETLDWKTRTRIIEGIAQGLLYLHEYSRVRIIHRDLKASNILLDDEMNPKISDFGLARIFGGTDSQAHTNRVVGTFGYIAPEYAMEGLFSIKSDVYSFGVLVLEIISGRKNTGFYKTDYISLPGHAWELWISGRGVELVDEKAGSLAASTALRYINVGLLCVQENPKDRPNMSSVVSMLSSEIAALPPPKKPAFSTTSLVSSSSSQTKSAGDPYFSGNHLSNSDIVPR